jgi:tRNA threonylcarbamoyl adenosine modification protein (Sua5/YciO/YrdC/YwlC family)
VGDDYDGRDMAPEFDCSDPSELVTGVRLARAAIGRGELVVIPTDTVYGIAADAFSPTAVKRLLEAKGRGRESPPPVLIPSVATLDALAEDVPDEVTALVAKFWPGGLTVILPARSSLSWDLGEARGTVALRMPANDVALKVLAETGPLAVSSANLTGKPAASSCADARADLGDSVSVYLNGGTVGAANDGAPDPASTIVDATELAGDGKAKLRIVRHGVISDNAIREVVGADRCA